MLTDVFKGPGVFEVRSDIPLKLCAVFSLVGPVKP